MLRRTLLALPLAIPFMAHAAQGATTTPLPVVTSFTILADLVQRVGGSFVTVTSLVGPDGDVHTFQPRPANLLQIKNAGAVVQNGVQLEPWLGRLIRSAGFRGQVVIAGAGIPTQTLKEGSRVATDPHIWQDPRNAARMVATIAQGLAAADPAHADAYRTNAAAFSAEILQEDATIERAMAATPAAKRQVITSHDAFGYYGARYGVVFRAAQGINTEAEPTPRDLGRLAAQIKADGVRAIFVENMTDPRIAEALAREAGAVVGGKVYSDSLSPPGGPASTYLDMLRHNTRLFTEAMAKQ